MAWSAQKCSIRLVLPLPGRAGDDHELLTIFHQIFYEAANLALPPNKYRACALPLCWGQRHGTRRRLRLQGWRTEKGGLVRG
jgi:hypothetical protein